MASRVVRATRREEEIGCRPNEVVQFSTVHLSTGPRLHYAERGDQTGETIVFLQAYVHSWY